MIPFARMAVYGNKAATPDPIKKILSGTGNLYVLYSDGSLYARGIQSQGQFGIGNQTQQTAWVLVRNNVMDFWVTSNSTLLRFNDNKFLLIGSQMPVGSTSVNTVGIDVSSKLSSFFENNSIKQVGINQCFYALTSTGELYGMGYQGSYGMLGIGSTSSVSTLQLLTTGVSSFKVANTYTGILKGTNYYHAGDSSLGQSGLNTTSAVTTFTQPNLGTLVQDYSLTFGTLILYRPSVSNNIFVTGYQQFGASADGVNAASQRNVITDLGSSFTFPSVPTSFVQMPADQSGRHLMVCNDGIYYTGRNMAGEAVNGTTSTPTLRLTLQNGTPALMAKIKSICAGLYLNGFVYDGNQVYMAGRLSALGLTDSTVYTAITLPK